MESQYKSKLKSIVLDLRHTLEGRYDDAGFWRPGDLEERLAALGVRRDREPLGLEQLSHLSKDDQRARLIVDAFVQSALQADRSREEAIGMFLQESAYTWANRLLALRCMEARSLIDEIIIQKENYGGRSLKHYRLTRQNPEVCTGEDGGLYAALFAEFEKRSQELRLLFRTDEPVIALKPGVAALKKCIRLLSAADEIFTAPDALGWAYQYWNTEEKNRVFEKVRTVKSAKIEKYDIIPVTQLYTEPYMVKFLVQNSLGALWMAMHPESHLCESWEYYVRDADRIPSPIKPLNEISFLDPCVGSGHFLLEAFDLLYVMYEEEGELSTPEEICHAILSQNLYGIDIDERAVQIAACALYMKAKEKDPTFTPVRINLTATNIHPGSDMDHLTAFLNKHPEDRHFESTLRMIFESLYHADELGTLLQIEEPVEKEFRFLKAVEDEKKGGPPKQKPLFAQMEKPEQAPLPLGAISYEEWKAGLLARLYVHFEEEFGSEDFSSRFFGETAEKGLSLFDFLSRRYDVVATNPPYMGSKNMGPVVKKYVESHFTSGKRDLYAAFILRCLELAKPETGRVAMVTQQSWMFLRSFADLRAIEEDKLEKAKGFTGILRETSIETLAHLGPGAFGEISGEVVNIVLFTLANKQPENEHRLTAFRLIGPKSPEEKDIILQKSMKEEISSDKTKPKQIKMLKIIESPLVYWVRPYFLEILSSQSRLRDLAHVKQGLATGDNNRFIRQFWETFFPDNRWITYAKGGGYKRWLGFREWVVDWKYDGKAINLHPGSRFQNEQYYKKSGWSYSQVARGSFAVRRIKNAIFDVKGSSIFFKDNKDEQCIVPLLQTRPVTYLLRCLRPMLEFKEGTVSNIPLPNDSSLSLNYLSLSINLKRNILSYELTDPEFLSDIDKSCESKIKIDVIDNIISSYLENEGFKAYGLTGMEKFSVLNETSTPAGWFPLLSNFDILPPFPKNFPKIPDKILEDLQTNDHRTPDNHELENLRKRLKSLYEAGPGIKEEIDNREENTIDDDDKENDQVAVGACIPIPAETFLEEISQKMEIHPISVYWLLKEGIEQEGWRCLPEEQRLAKDRFTILILHLLGHRWPKQIEAGEAVPSWAEADGFIVFMEGTHKTTLHSRLRQRLAAECGDKQISSEENTFEEIMGTSLATWTRKNFFRHHISQFKKRPIAWHVSSAKWTNRPRQDPAFECIVYYHKTDGDLLPKLKNQYGIPLIKSLETELRGLENSNGILSDEQEKRKTLLMDHIPELKAFEGILTRIIASGFGPEILRSQLRQYAINDAMLCLKAKWLKKLSDRIQGDSLAQWRQQADKTCLHPDFSLWISEAITQIDYHCAVVGPKPPLEKFLDVDPTSKDLAALICLEFEPMLADALKCACAVWWKRFDDAVLKPISEKIKEAKKELQSLKEHPPDLKNGFSTLTDVKRKINDLKVDVKAWQKGLNLKSVQAKDVRDVIESWRCTEALAWEPWLSDQAMYDQLSSLNAKRPVPRSVAEFILQESLYQPDINDGVRVNIAPLQKAGLLAADVLADKDVDKAIADRAAWRDDERRWCREGKLPKPGWWD